MTLRETDSILRTHDGDRAAAPGEPIARTLEPSFIRLARRPEVPRIPRPLSEATPSRPPHEAI